MGQIGLPAAHPTFTGRRFTGGWRRVVAVALMVGFHGMAQDSAPWPIPRTIPPRFDRELAADHTVRAWRQTDGLPSDQVTCLVQGSDGYLWVGTTAGLARFDGVRFVRFDHGNVPELADHRIRALAEDGAGNLWVVTGEHQLVVLGEWGWSLPGTGTLSVDGSFSLQTQDDGSVMGHLTMGRLGSWMPGPRAPRIEVRWDLPEDTVRVLEGSAHPQVLVTHEELRIGHPGEANERRYRFAPQSQRNPMAQMLARAPGDSAWLLRGAYGGSQAFELFRIAGNQVAMIDDSVPHPRSFSPSIATDHAGGVWHAAGSGYIGHATTTERIRYRLPGTDQEVFPLGLVRGLGASIWAAVENAGLLEIRPRRFQSIRDAEGLPHAMVRCVAPDTRGGVWAGTENGVARVQSEAAQGEWQAIPSGLEGHTVRALQLGNDGTLWAGSSRGLFVQRGSEWEPVPIPRLRNGASDGDGLGSLKVRDLLAGRGGEVWMVAAHQVAVAPEPGGAMSTVAFLPSAGPTDMLEDHAGHRWLATERAGVLVLGRDPAASVLGQPMEPVPGFPGDQWRWKPSAWLRETNGLPSDHVWEMLEDSDRDLWMLGPRGLLRLPHNTARSLVVGTGIPNGPDAAPFVFTTHHGLPELALNTLADDGEGNLWLGGDQGAYRIPRASLLAVARGASTRLSVETFTVADGLPADETNGRISHPAVVRDDAGRIWMSTVRGLACLRPEPQTGFDDGRGVAIEEVRADGWILATTLPQDPEGGRVGAEIPNQARRNPEEGMPVRRLSRPVVVQAGRGRVLEIRFTGFDPTAPRALRFRYQLEGYENSIHEVGDRRVAYFTNLDPGTYRFRVWASGHSGVWMARPAELGITLLPEFWETRWFQVLVGLSAVGMVAGGVTLRVRRIRQLERLRRRADRTDLRNRLARDLHDGVGSGLARLALLAHLPEDDARNPDRVARQFRDLASAVQELAQTVREIAWSARPSAISLESLMAQIAQQTGEFLGAAGIRCRTSLPLEFPALELEPEPRLDLYFAAKEAVTNIVRHSHATDARLDVEFRDGLLILSLWDNGCGLAVSATETITDPASGGGGGNGLPNLKARLKCLGGRVVVGTGNDAPAQGTQVRIEVPLKTLGSHSGSSD